MALQQPWTGRPWPQDQPAQPHLPPWPIQDIAGTVKGLSCPDADVPPSLACKLRASAAFCAPAHLLPAVPKGSSGIAD